MRPVTAARRRRAVKLMTDQCTVTRKGAVVVVDGRETWPDEQVYAGCCKVQTHEAYESLPEAGGHVYTVQRYRLDIPVGAGPLTVGDVATVDGYRHPFRVVAEMDKTHLTAQRVPVEMVTE